MCDFVLRVCVKMEELVLTGGAKSMTFRSLSELELNKFYFISDAERVTTKYGPTIVVYIDNYKVFLPKRFAKITDEAFDNIKLSYMKVYREEGYNYPLITFSKTKQ